MWIGECVTAKKMYVLYLNSLEFVEEILVASSQSKYNIYVTKYSLGKNSTRGQIHSYWLKFLSIYSSVGRNMTVRGVVSLIGKKTENKRDKKLLLGLKQKYW